YPQRPSQSSTPVQSDGETNMGVNGAPCPSPQPAQSPHQ
uniref:CSON007445 protein n=1 Tax=Culicoides sonorensis TaxID=179676 RepID=A0A336LD44_CULSO